MAATIDLPKIVEQAILPLKSKPEKAALFTNTVSSNVQITGLVSVTGADDVLALCEMLSLLPFTRANNASSALRRLEIQFSVKDLKAGEDDTLQNTRIEALRVNLDIVLRPFINWPGVVGRQRLCRLNLSSFNTDLRVSTTSLNRTNLITEVKIGQKAFYSPLLNRALKFVVATSENASIQQFLGKTKSLLNFAFFLISIPLFVYLVFADFPKTPKAEFEEPTHASSVWLDTTLQDCVNDSITTADLPEDWHSITSQFPVILPPHSTPDSFSRRASVDPSAVPTPKSAEVEISKNTKPIDAAIEEQNNRRKRVAFEKLPPLPESPAVAVEADKREELGKASVPETAKPAAATEKNESDKAMTGTAAASSKDTANITPTAPKPKTRVSPNGRSQNNNARVPFARAVDSVRLRRSQNHPAALRPTFNPQNSPTFPTNFFQSGQHFNQPVSPEMHFENPGFVEPMYPHNIPYGPLPIANSNEFPFYPPPPPQFQPQWHPDGFQGSFNPLFHHNEQSHWLQNNHQTPLNAAAPSFAPPAPQFGPFHSYGQHSPSPFQPPLPSMPKNSQAEHNNFQQPFTPNYNNTSESQLSGGNQQEPVQNKSAELHNAARLFQRTSSPISQLPISLPKTSALTTLIRSRSPDKGNSAPASPTISAIGAERSRSPIRSQSPFHALPTIHTQFRFDSAEDKLARVETRSIWDNPSEPLTATQPKNVAVSMGGLMIYENPSDFATPLQSFGEDPQQNVFGLEKAQSHFDSVETTPDLASDWTESSPEVENWRSGSSWRKMTDSEIIRSGNGNPEVNRRPAFDGDHWNGLAHQAQNTRGSKGTRRKRNPKAGAVPGLPNYQGPIKIKK